MGRRGGVGSFWGPQFKEGVGALTCEGPMRFELGENFE